MSNNYIDNMMASYMSDIQKMGEKNSELNEILGKPISWKKFSKLDADVQREYINDLVDKYGATIRAFAKMFGKDVTTINKHFKGILAVPPNMYQRMPYDKWVTFMNFVEGKDTNISDTQDTDITTADDPIENPVADISEPDDVDEEVVNETVNAMEITTVTENDVAYGKSMWPQVQSSKGDNVKFSVKGNINIKHICAHLASTIPDGTYCSIRIICKTL